MILQDALGAGDGTFAAPKTFAVGDGAISVAVGDLDGDAIPDLAVANAGEDTVSILVGAGGGTFAPHQQFNVGRHPFSVAIGDLDGDGIPDLAVANGASDDVSVLLGAGDGTFAPEQRFGAGASPRSVAIGDLDGDGVPDLAVANGGGFNDGDDDVSVLLGAGDGTFAPEQRFGAGDSPRSVAVGDLDGDGVPDLAVANATSDDISVLLAAGDGTFAPGQRFGAGDGPCSVAIGDLDGDGAPDLAVTDLSNDSVSTLIGAGDGTFAAQRTFGVGDGPISVAIADLDGDGSPDLAVANAGSIATDAAVAGDVSILLGFGDGTFASNQGPLITGSRPRSVVIGELDGDGILDVVVANAQSDDVSVLLGNGDGTFAAQQTYPAGIAPQSVAISDLDGDGISDLAVANLIGNVSILIGGGDGTFAAEQTFVAGDSPISVAIGDLDADGIPDLAVANSGFNDVSILLGAGDGTFAGQQRFVAGDFPESVAIGDFNADGILDLAAANRVSETTVSILLGAGDGTFAAPQNFGAAKGSSSVAIGDLDADGILDLAVASGLFSDGDNVSTLLGAGDGTFTDQRMFDVGRNPQSVAIGDLDADGILDLAVANAESDDLSILLGVGDGTFAAQQRFAASNGNGVKGSKPQSVAIGDLDGDGFPDLAVANEFIDNLSVLIGNSLAPSVWTGDASAAFSDANNWIPAQPPADASLEPNVAIFDSTVAPFGPLEEIVLDADASLWALQHANEDVHFDLNGSRMTLLGDSLPDQGPIALDVGVVQSGSGAPTLPEVGPTLRLTNSADTPSLLSTVRASVGKNGSADLEIDGAGGPLALEVIGDLDIGRRGDATVVLTGASAELLYGDPGATGDDVSVGSGAFGLIEVTGGALGAAGSVDSWRMGRGDNGLGVVRIDGPASTWSHQSEEMTIGARGRGLIEIVNGGTLTTQVIDGALLGQKAVGKGDALISGAGSSWTDLSPAIRVGGDGEGVLTVESGGTIIASTIALGLRGVLSGDSVVESNVVASSGTVAPSAGQSLTIEGDYQQSFDDGVSGPRAGALAVDLTDGSEWSRLDVTGVAALAGALRVEAGPEFDPAVGERFEVLTAASLEGSRFDVAFLPGLDRGRFLRVEYQDGGGLRGGGSVTLVVDTILSRGVDLEDPESTTVTGLPSTAALADIAGVDQQGALTSADGQPDLALAIPAENTPSVNPGAVVVLVNGGVESGVWQGFSGGTVQVSVGPNPSALAAGDMDEDKDLDDDLLVATVGDRALTALLNMGGGTLTPAASAALSFDPADLVLRDFDRDAGGRLDIAVVGSDPQDGGFLASLLNAGGMGPGWNGFESPATTPLGLDPTVLAAGDMDEDKDLDEDLAVADGGNASVHIVENLGGGTGEQWQGFIAMGQVAVGAAPVDIALRDLDLDGDLDFVTADRNGDTISISLAGPGLAFNPSASLPVGDRPRSIAVADLDSDGDADLGVVVDADEGSTTERTLRILRNDLDAPGGQLAFAPATDVETTTDPLLVLAGEVDGRAGDDLVAVGEATEPGLRGAARMGEASTILVESCPADLNGDGQVSSRDLALLLAVWGSSELSADLNGDGVVGSQDLALLLSDWGACQ